MWLEQELLRQENVEHRPRDSQSGSHESLTVIGPSNMWLETLLDCLSYRLAERSEHYKDDAARHIVQMAKRLKVELKSQVFDGRNPIPITSFLHSGFQKVWNTNEICGNAGMW